MHRALPLGFSGQPCSGGKVSGTYVDSILCLVLVMPEHDGPAVLAEVVMDDLLVEGIRGKVFFTFDRDFVARSEENEKSAVHAKRAVAINDFLLFDRSGQSHAELDALAMARSFVSFLSGGHDFIRLWG